MGAATGNGGAASARGGRPPLSSAAPMVRPLWRAAAVTIVLAIAAPSLPQQEAAAPQEESPRQEVLPDLRIVRMEVLPQTLADGTTARLSVMVHNRSAAVAAGNIAIETTHDRRTPQPLPLRQQVLYLEPDALAEVEFQVHGLAMSASPYTFYAVVDIDDAVDEADESNNTAWLRTRVCGGVDVPERADGFDNDCDGMIDEELGLPADPDVALRMLRALQRRNLIDAAPLVYALPRPFAPEPVRYAARLASEEGGYVGRPLPQRGRGAGGTDPQEVVAALPGDYAGSELTLIDWNGHRLRSGDLVSLHDARGETIIAGAGGGGRVLVRTPFRTQEGLFTIIAPAGVFGDPVSSGSDVALVTFNGTFVTAEGGGGGVLNADRRKLAGWETFTLTLEGER